MNYIRSNKIYIRRSTTPVYMYRYTYNIIYIYIYTHHTCKYLGAYYTHYYLLCAYDRKKNKNKNIIRRDKVVCTRTHTTTTRELYTEMAAVTGPDHSLYFIITYRYIGIYIGTTIPVDTSRAVITHSGAV